MSTRCSATTTAGAPCRAWAVRGADPPLCSTHSGRTVGAGAPVGNVNAVKHGFFRRKLSHQDLADLVANLNNIDIIDDEVAINRVLLSKLLNFMQENEDDLEIIVRIAPLILRTTAGIANLLRARRAISHESANSLLDALGTALDEISNEWGIRL
jgi:hypothetical protein